MVHGPLFTALSPSPVSSVRTRQNQKPSQDNSNAIKRSDESVSSHVSSLSPPPSYRATLDKVSRFPALSNCVAAGLESIPMSVFSVDKPPAVAVTNSSNPAAAAVAKKRAGSQLVRARSKFFARRNRKTAPVASQNTDSYVNPTFFLAEDEAEKEHDRQRHVNELLQQASRTEYPGASRRRHTNHTINRPFQLDELPEKPKAPSIPSIARSIRKKVSTFRSFDRNIKFSPFISRQKALDESIIKSRGPRSKRPHPVHLPVPRPIEIVSDETTSSGSAKQSTSGSTVTNEVEDVARVDPVQETGPFGLTVLPQSSSTTEYGLKRKNALAYPGPTVDDLRFQTSPSVAAALSQLHNRSLPLWNQEQILQQQNRKTVSPPPLIVQHGQTGDEHFDDYYYKIPGRRTSSTVAVYALPVQTHGVKDIRAFRFPAELPIEKNRDRRDSYIVDQDSFHTFARETTFHGIKRIGMQTRFSMFVYWYIAVLFSYSMCVIFISFIVRDMLQNPLKTTITANEPYYQMPVYYLCDSNQVWQTSMDRSPYKALKPFIESYVLSSWQGSSNAAFEAYVSKLRGAESNNTVVNNTQAALELLSRPYEQFLSAVRPDYDQLELLCLYDRRSCAATGIVTKDVWLLQRGWCRAYYFTRNCDDNNGSRSAIAGRGCQRPLNILLRFNVKDNWLGQSLTLDDFTSSFQRFVSVHTSFNRYSDSTVSSIEEHDELTRSRPVDAAIADNDDLEDVLPTYSSLYSEDIHLLSAGTYKQMNSEYHFYTAAAAGNCAGDELAYQKCLTDCYLASVEQLNRCHLFKGARAGKASSASCTLEQVLSSFLTRFDYDTDWRHQNQSVSLRTRDDITSKSKNIEVASTAGTAKGSHKGMGQLSKTKQRDFEQRCNCQRPCNRHYYQSQATEVRAPSSTGPTLLKALIPEVANVPTDELRDYVAVLRLELASVSRVKVSVDSVISIQNLFSNIGGQLGLFVGGSLISVCEVIDWLMRYFNICRWH